MGVKLHEVKCVLTSNNKQGCGYVLTNLKKAGSYRPPGGEMGGEDDADVRMRWWLPEEKEQTFQFPM